MAQEKNWTILEPFPIPEDFQAAIRGHPLVAQTLIQRGYRTIEAARAFLDLDAYQPTPPTELPDMETACGLLVNALEEGKRILVWGDYDVDGQTATTTLVEGLRELGGSVNYHLPVRAEESHGITRGVLETYLQHGFDLFLTCDTGISEHENVALLREAGKTVIVTDHHTLGKFLPPADAVINPQRLPEDHPLRTLPGVGVAYQLMDALFNAMGHRFDSDRYSELSALGIVADVAALYGDTRYLLQKGLASLRRTRRVGLQTIYDYAGLNPLHLNEEHIGFQIAPRLNAVGRIGDANPIVELLTTTDAGRARVLSTQIEAMNMKRRFVTRQVEKAAESMLQSSPEDRHAPAIVLYHPGWPGGVVGVVAGHLAERYNKPAILLTGEDRIHGSARSVQGINITDAIASQADLLNSFGGHPMAAGMSMPASVFPTFKRGLLSDVEEKSRQVEIKSELEISAVLAVDEINLDFIDQIQRLAPFGPGNPPLNFMIKDLTLISSSSVGKQGEHRQVLAADEFENQQRLIWWNGSDEPLPEAQFDLVCRLSKSDYKGDPQVNVEWKDFRLSEKGIKTVESRHFQWIDHRNAVSPASILNRILKTHPDAQVWAEGQDSDGIQGLSRLELSACETLVIWTAPPSLSVLNDVIQHVSPRQVFVVGQSRLSDSYGEFLTRVAGMAKYAIRHKNGQATLDALACACATEQDAVRVCLQLWEAKGEFSVEFNVGEIHLTKINRAPDLKVVEILEEILRSMLAEIQAFRRCFKVVDLDTLS